MSSCVNMNSQEFKDLVEQTGLNPLVLKSQIGVWNDITKQERIPTLQEIQQYHQIKQESEEYTDDVSKIHEEIGSDILNKEEFFKNNFAGMLFSTTSGGYTTTAEATKHLKKNAKSFNEYKEFKKDLAKRLKSNLANYKKLNTKSKNTLEYMNEVKNFTKAISKIEDDIASLQGVNEAQFILKDIIEELDYLENELTNSNPFSIQNKEIIHRLNVLSKLILGHPITGRTIMNSDEAFTQINGSDIEGFNSLKAKMSDTKNEYDAFVKRVAVEAITKNELYLTAIANMEQEDVDKFFEGFKDDLGKDINLAQSYMLGIDSNKDSNYVKGINIIYQTNIKKVQQNIAQDETRIQELYHILTDKNFNFQDFYNKDSNGILTDQLIGKYTNKWYDKIGEILKLRNELSFTRESLKDTKYKVFINSLDKNTDIIDIRKIKAFKDAFSENYGEFFTFSDEEMSSYEESLRKRLGKTYDKNIEEQMTLMKVFDSRIEDLIISGNKNVEKISDSESPLKFLENFYSENKYKRIKTSVNGKEAEFFNIGKYNRIIPKEQIKNSNGDLVNSGFYNEVFNNQIDKDDDIFEMWELLHKMLTEHINPAYYVDGKFIRDTTIPMLKKDFQETIATSFKEGGVINMIRAIVSKAINGWKDMWFEKTQVADEKGLVPNYSNVAQREIHEYTKALLTKSQPELIRMANQKGLKFENDASKKEIADGIARAEILPTFSTDIVKNILAVSRLAVVQRARRDSSFMIELLYDQHVKSGENRKNSNMKMRHWINVMVYGHRNRPSEENNVVSKSNIKRFTESEKRILKIYDEQLRGDGKEIEFNDGDIFYNKIIENGTDKYYENSFFSDDEGVEHKAKKEISKDEFEEKLGEYIKSQTDVMGVSLTVAGILKGIMEMLSLKFLGFSAKSGIKNRIDGLIMNMIRDAEGYHWTEGNLKHSSRILSFSNLIRIGNGKLDFINKKRAEQLKTLDMMMERMDILQDRKDFRDKKDKTSTFGQHKDLFKPYNLAVGLPEYKNQMEIALSIMQDVKIKSAFGVETGLCNGTGIMLDENGQKVDDNNFFPAFKPGTLELKDEYKYTAEAFDENKKLRTDIDVSIFINKENIGYETFELIKEDANNKVHQLASTINQVISRTQGNFSNLDTIMMMNSVWGRMAMMFKRYMPEHFNQRWGSMDADIITGKKAYEGRYRVIMRNPGALGIAASAALFIGAGPLFGLPALGVGFILPYFYNLMAKKVFKKEVTKGLADNLLISAGMLQEIIIRTLNLPATLVKSPKDLRDIKKLTKNKSFEKVMEKGVLTEQEVGAIKATAQDLSVQISMILLIMLAKDIFGGGDDDEDEEKKQIRNYIDNFGNQLLSNLNIYQNPVKLKEDTGNILLISILADTMRFAKMVKKHHEDGAYTVGELIEKAAKVQPIVPLFNNPFGIVTRALDSERGIFKEDREYQKGQWFDRHNMSDESKAKLRNENERALLKQVYIDDLKERLEKEYDMDGTEARKVAKEFSNKLMRDPEVIRQTRKGETQVEFMDRFNLKKSKKEASKKVKEFDINEAMNKKKDKEEKEEEIIEKKERDDIFRGYVK